MIGWTRCLAVESASAGIQVNTPAPGLVETPRFLRITRRLAAAFLASANAVGHWQRIDGGGRVFRPMDNPGKSYQLC